MSEERKATVEEFNKRLEEASKAEAADLIDTFIKFQSLMARHLLDIEEFRDLFDEEYINTKLRGFAFHMAPLIMSMFPTTFFDGELDEDEKDKMMGMARNVCILMFAGVLWYEKKY